VTKCLKAGIEDSFPRQRIETIASVAIQRLGEPLIATTIAVARQIKNLTVRLGVPYSVARRTALRGLLVYCRPVRRKYEDQNSTVNKGGDKVTQEDKLSKKSEVIPD
jgi:hypothetical protein